MRKILKIYDNIRDYYSENKKAIIVSGVLVISVLSILIAVTVTTLNYKYEKELAQLKKQRIEISNRANLDKENYKNMEDLLGDLYENRKESNLKDVNLSNLYTEDEIKVHANLFLNIIDEESRQKASTSLPIQSKARKGILTTTDGYENYKSVSNEIQFLGIDYNETDKNYTASIIASRMGTYDGGATQTKTVSLVIYYADSKIYNWEWKENEQ